jgi:hypothetical protein
MGVDGVLVILSALVVSISFIALSLQRLFPGVSNAACVDNVQGNEECKSVNGKYQTYSKEAADLLGWLAIVSQTIIQALFVFLLYFMMKFKK